MHHQSDDGRRWTRVECHVEVATTQGWLSRDNPLLSLHALRVLTTHPGLARPLSARASHERGLWPRCFMVLKELGPGTRDSCGAAPAPTFPRPFLLVDGPVPPRGRPDQGRCPSTR